MIDHKFLKLRKVLGCFPLQTIAFRGPGRIGVHSSHSSLRRTGRASAGVATNGFRWGEACCSPRTSRT